MLTKLALAASVLMIAASAEAQIKVEYAYVKDGFLKHGTYVSYPVDVKKPELGPEDWEQKLPDVYKIMCEMINKQIEEEQAAKPSAGAPARPRAKFKKVDWGTSGALSQLYRAPRKKAKKKSPYASRTSARRKRHYFDRRR